MKKQLKQVEEFHEAFNQEIQYIPTAGERILGSFRYALMKEENEEYLEACNSNDLIGIADALTDQLYVLCGTILSHGLQDVIEKCFDEVAASNMSKLDSNGKPIINGENGVDDPSKPYGKVLKSDLYFPPNLEQFFVRKLQIIPVGDKYHLKEYGDSEFIEEFLSEEDAIEFVENQDQDIDLYIHAPDGTVKEKLYFLQ